MAYNDFNYSLAKGSDAAAYNLATQSCGFRTSCTGIPPISCSGFSGNYKPVVGLPSTCVNCDKLVWPAILGVVIIACAFAMMVALLMIFAMGKHRTRSVLVLRVWGGTFTILISHAQALGIIGSLDLQWPELLQQLLAAISLDVLRFDRLSCLLGRSNQADEGAHVSVGLCARCSSNTTDPSAKLPLPLTQTCLSHLCST